MNVCCQFHSGLSLLFIVPYQTSLLQLNFFYFHAWHLFPSVCVGFCSVWPWGFIVLLNLALRFRFSREHPQHVPPNTKFICSDLSVSDRMQYERLWWPDYVGIGFSPLLKHYRHGRTQLHFLFVALSLHGERHWIRKVIQINNKLF